MDPDATKFENHCPIHGKQDVFLKARWYWDEHLDFERKKKMKHLLSGLFFFLQLRDVIDLIKLLSNNVAWPLCFAVLLGHSQSFIWGKNIFLKCNQKLISLSSMTTGWLFSNLALSWKIFTHLVVNFSLTKWELARKDNGVFSPLLAFF